MSAEIFGPILPILTYQHEATCVDFINQREKPLALYCFCNDKHAVKSLLRKIQSGGAVINSCIVHVGIDDLPFGGIGNSGIGNYHGPEGFKTFSHQRAVFYQGWFNSFSLLKPPYSAWKKSLIKFLTRWV